jgi:hypothetical protein
MDTAQITAQVTDFIHNYPLISIAALAAVVYFVYKSPKESFKVLVIVVILGITGYLVLQLGSSTETGMGEKKEMINKSKKALDE